MKVYLSGNMTPCTNHYHKWCNLMPQQLGPRFNCTKAKDLALANCSDPGKYIVHHDLARLKRCDIVIVNLGVTDRTHHLTGAIVEVYEAYKQGKPVYAFTESGSIRSEQSNSPWMQEFITREFGSKEELITFLKDEDNMI